MKITKLLCFGMLILFANTLFGAENNSKWDLLINVGGKGVHRVKSNKCYPKEVLENQIPLTDSVPDFKWAADHNQSFSSETYEIGNIGQTKFFDIYQHLDEGYYDYIKIIVFENEARESCPFFISIDNNHSVVLSKSYPLNIKGIELIASTMRVTGNGGYWFEHYYSFSRGLPKEVDIMKNIDKTMDKIYAKFNMGAGFRSGSLDLKNMKYIISLFKKGACAGCSAGKVELQLGMKDGDLFVESESVQLFEE